MSLSLLQHHKPRTNTVWEFDLAGLTKQQADAVALQYNATLVAELRKKSFSEPYLFIKTLYEGLTSEQERAALVAQLAEFRLEKRGGHPKSGRKPTGRIRKGVTLTLSPKALENMRKLPNASQFISEYLESKAVSTYIATLSNPNETK